jgi:hypothetical protein
MYRLLLIPKIDFLLQKRFTQALFLSQKNPIHHLISFNIYVSINLTSEPVSSQFVPSYQLFQSKFYPHFSLFPRATHVVLLNLIVLDDPKPMKDIVVK